jgi:hypothetical protein
MKGNYERNTVNKKAPKRRQNPKRGHSVVNRLKKSTPPVNGTKSLVCVLVRVFTVSWCFREFRNRCTKNEVFFQIHCFIQFRKFHVADLSLVNDTHLKNLKNKNFV